MKLNYKRTFFIGFAFLSISAFWQLYDNIVPLILSNTFGIGEKVTGVIMALDNILALFLLPFFGSLSDKTHTKLGKRTPYIIVGTLVASTAMVLIPTANRTKNLTMFIIALGIALLAMGSYRSPAVALMPDLTPKPLRSKANSIINLMGTFGGAFALVMIKLLVPKGDHPDYTWLYITVMALMLLAVLLLVLMIRENKVAKTVEEENRLLMERGEVNEEVAVTDSRSTTNDHDDMTPDVRRSFRFLLVSIFFWFTAYNAVTTAFSRYANKVWKIEGGGFANCLIIAMAAAAIAFVPIGIISSKIGRKKVIIVGVLLMTASYAAGCFFTEYSPLINVVFACTGIGWASINVNSYPMVVEMSRGGNVGKYTGIYYTFSMAAQIFTPIFSGFLLEEINYYVLFPYAVVFSLLSLVGMLFVKHGEAVSISKEVVS